MPNVQLCIFKLTSQQAYDLWHMLSLLRLGRVPLVHILELSGRAKQYWVYTYIVIVHLSRGGAWVSSRSLESAPRSTPPVQHHDRVVSGSSDAL